MRIEVIETIMSILIDVRTPEKISGAIILLKGMLLFLRSNTSEFKA